LTGHVVVTDMKDARAILMNAKAVLEEKFKIDHVTIQMEDEEMRTAEPLLRI
jgi:cobalt-zinc-cadmium efflux system protein